MVEIITFIWLLLTAGLVYMVYRETGPFTAIFSALISIVELGINIYLVRRVTQSVREIALLLLSHVDKTHGTQNDTMDRLTNLLEKHLEIGH